ncbi:hypothetical protein BB559_000603 [Furculomyces boomerangus]|uniref:non-specific serine/threonine protein kinase n=1 Tax=Furculomyces boomerangus TaxID=61424 RepID=A0A2T9Z4N7_9FUNG|nr:hypothetical protein BB559_000603 [Furculomyces boomerangus]
MLLVLVPGKWPLTTYNQTYLNPTTAPAFPPNNSHIYTSKSVPPQPPPLPPISKKVSDALNAAAAQSPSPFVTQEQKNSATRKRVVKDFHFGRTLGEGSYSTVIEATEISTEVVYAAKILDKRHIIKEKKTKYVTIERNVLHILKHPFIIKLHYTFQDTRSLYFIIDIADNGELLTWVRKFGGLSEKCSQFYLAELIVAVQYMHSRGIIHRDLKPENILLGKDMHILVTDFGTAKILNDSDPNHNESRTNSFVGTAEYVSPELLLDKPPEKSSDIWALGCIAYQLLAGRPPFKGTNEYQTFQKILKAEYEFPPHFSPAAKDLIEKILVLDPKLRLGSTNIQDLKDHIFFKGIDWENIINQTPPKIEGLLDPESNPRKSRASSESSASLEINNAIYNNRRVPPKIPPKPHIATNLYDFPNNIENHNVKPRASYQETDLSQIPNAQNNDYSEPPNTHVEEYIRPNNPHYNPNHLSTKSNRTSNPTLNGRRSHPKKLPQSTLSRQYINKISSDELYNLDAPEPVMPLDSNELAEVIERQRQQQMLNANPLSKQNKNSKYEEYSESNKEYGTVQQPYINPEIDPNSPDAYNKALRLKRSFKKKRGFFETMFFCCNCFSK